MGGRDEDSSILPRTDDLQERKLEVAYSVAKISQKQNFKRTQKDRTPKKRVTSHKSLHITASIKNKINIIHSYNKVNPKKENTIKPSKR